MQFETKISKETVLEFFTEEEVKLNKQFLSDGYICLPVSNKSWLDKICHLVVKLACDHLRIDFPDLPVKFLNEIHHYVSAAKLNALRLHIIEGLRSTSWFRSLYFNLAKQALYILVGNELVMQRGIGLSIQLPDDDSSLLNMHADSWSGDSPFEVVVWLPLVDCYRTKSMYLLPPESAKRLNENFSIIEKMTNNEILDKLKDEIKYLEVPYGNFLLFNHNLPHGNRINEEPETRWSMNCRFKSVFSPYADKKLGEFFEPITLRTATRIGMAYHFPEI